MKKGIIITVVTMNLERTMNSRIVASIIEEGQVLDLDLVRKHINENYADEFAIFISYADMEMLEGLMERAWSGVKE